MIRYLFLLTLTFALAACAGDPPKEPLEVRAVAPPPKPAVATTKPAAAAPEPHRASEENPGSIEGKHISVVEIRYVGAPTVDEARLRSYMGTRAGGVYSSEQIDSDIKALYESGNIDDLRVLAEPAGDNLHVIYEVTPRATSFHSGFVGNSAFSDKRLAKETGLRVGVELTPDSLASARGNLKAFYRSQGYWRAKVEVASWGNESNFFFLIEEGPRSRG